MNRENKLILLSKFMKLGLTQTGSLRYVRLAYAAAEKGDYAASLFYTDRVKELFQESDRRLKDIQITNGLTEKDYSRLASIQKSMSLALETLENAVVEMPGKGIR